MAYPLPYWDGVQHTGRFSVPCIRFSIARSASNPPLPRSRRELLLAPVLLAGVATPAAAAAGVVLHPAQEVLESWTVRDGGRLYFQGLDGVRWELVTTVDDPVIGNRGSGSFHPVEADRVASALDAIQFPMEQVDAEIFLLPFPRRALLDSNAAGMTLFLSPGVWPLSDAQTHMLVAHEIGHLVQHALLSDRDGAGWSRFRELRGIQDTDIYHEGAVHRNRPHEIFAEDFRVLFGGSLAAGSGRVENPDLVPPSEVPGLREFMQALPQRRVNAEAPGGLVCSPNPTPAGTRIALAGPASTGAVTSVTVEVLDLQGRRVTRLRLDDAGHALWDGRLADGSPASAGVYFLHAVDGAQRWTGKLLIAR